jgi:glucosylceramidase
MHHFCRLTLIFALGSVLLSFCASALAAPARPAAPTATAVSTSAAGRPAKKKHKPSPPPPPASAAIAVNPQNDYQYAFWRTTGGRIEEAYDNGSWHGPVSRGWSATSAPSAGVNAAGQQFVVFAGREGHIYEATFTRRWGRPVDLTASGHWGARGITNSTPTVAVNPSGHHRYLFWRRTNGRIYEAWNNGRWHGPAGRGWKTSSGPSAAASADGHQYVTWSAPGGDLLQSVHSQSWSRPVDLTRVYGWGANGRSSSAPGLAVNPSNGHQYLFWRGRGNNLFEAYFDGRWHPPANRGWGAASAPSAAVAADGHQFLLWLGSGGRLYEAWHESAWVGAVGRWRLSVGPGDYAEVVETTPSLSERMTPLSDAQFGTTRPGRIPMITVNDGLRYQQVKGIGAAMTDTSAWLIQNQLSPGTRASLMHDLFTKDGIHLGFTLIPIGGSDFSVAGQPYTYDDLPAGQTDPTLSHFSTVHDESYILPLLRQMLALAPHAETFAVPWSPPAWMKANDRLDDLGHQGTLLGSSYAPLASYFVKVLESYAQQGVPIYAIAPENEPRAASAFPAMYFPEPDEAQWLSQYLGPALAAAHLSPKVYGSNTSWQLENYADSLATSPARSNLNGIAWHCYGGIPTVMSNLHNRAANLDQIVTECAPNLGHYAVPEIAIGAMRNWASEVTLWNIATDPSGGPVEAPNSGCHGCRGLVTVNESTHQVSFNPDYYELGQIGAFVQSGGWRIGSNNFVTYRQQPSGSWATSGLDDVAFRNPDGSRVLVVYNNSQTTSRFAVGWRGRNFTHSLAPGATVTFRWNP